MQVLRDIKKEPRGCLINRYKYLGMFFFQGQCIIITTICCFSFVKLQTLTPATRRYELLIFYAKWLKSG